MEAVKTEVLATQPRVVERPNHPKIDEFLALAGEIR